MSTSQWMTLQDARDASFGKVAWWNLPTPDGERITITVSSEQQPVWKGVTGTMYLGGWKSGKWDGPGVFYFPDGCVLSGHWEEGRLLGKAMHVLLPESPCWIENHWPRSFLFDVTTQRPLPFVYIGCYTNFRMNDDDALVILKDGTVRRGPWQDNRPVGNWWKDHAAMESIGWEPMSQLLSFAEEPTVSRISPDSYPHAVSTCVSDQSLLSSTSTIILKPDDSSSWPEEWEGQRDSENSIGEWLTQLLRPDANSHEMQYYASRFYHDGFHSVTWIQQHCSTADVRSWMKKAHVRKVVPHLVSEQRIHTIALWLHKIVLGSHVHEWEVYEYAMNLADEGLLCIADIREFCTPDDVQTFDWMKPFHKRRLMIFLSTRFTLIAARRDTSDAFLFFFKIITQSVLLSLLVGLLDTLSRYA